MMYITIFSLLLVGFGIMFQRIRWLEIARRLMWQTMWEVDEAARKRLLADRKRLLLLQQEKSLWYRLEQMLHYSGWKRRFPRLTAEKWVLGNVVVLSSVFLLLLAVARRGTVAVTGGGVVVLAEYLLLEVHKARENRSVNENLLEFLNFLGNYSITAGEVTGIFNQISKYVDEPMKSVLDQCCYEAQTTGDAGMALLSMAEKIEHPKFKELAYNMEVSVRYCADFKLLVSSSRRSVREYLRMCEERKGMLREALVNMLLLVVLSLFALITVNGLIDRSIWEILIHTFPGRTALAIVGVVFVLLLRKLLELNQ